ncbi:membrane protein implicated in regulation of membrane protease activity [Actinoplanes octamycinicus]|uniref:Membrane protein implicated in regulation of membrane protease activity n=1 Tax=Actinoplanes octamycinicus TaxID=135948 RepID=A0A7W7H2W9_9ACTN|nr:hypothetical protein [Actinoplanes octamycinicus]MBB4743016.1 membrane protein implicated in regulation of membrane protease activity [Actinoplanes octamycinicus]GIE58129.1 hypothetical protein Aoc01nite_35310 [Actinoplanes octamycinicus]
MRGKVWLHRAAAVVCVLLTVPAVLWWKESILFVILLSLATQAWTSWGAAEAADDRAVSQRLDRIEQQLRHLPGAERGPDD